MIRRLFRFKTKQQNSTDIAFARRLRESFGLKVKDIELYRTAFIHKSASVSVLKNQEIHNERLEYLGDAILDAIVTEFLFSSFPKKDEGFLTKMRSRIVSRLCLNSIAIAIGLDKMVITLTNNPIAHKHIFGDALEALVGAIYIDKGYLYTSQWVTKHILSRHVNLEELQNTEHDFKSRIIELAQKHRYEILFHSQEVQPPQGSTPLFESKLFLNDQLIGNGFATSKKEAEQNAAMVALKRIDVLLPSIEVAETNNPGWHN